MLTAQNTQPVANSTSGNAPAPSAGSGVNPAVVLPPIDMPAMEPLSLTTPPPSAPTRVASPTMAGAASTPAWVSSASSADKPSLGAQPANSNSFTDENLAAIARELPNLGGAAAVDPVAEPVNTIISSSPPLDPSVVTATNSSPNAATTAVAASSSMRSIKENESTPESSLAATPLAEVSFAHSPTLSSTGQVSSPTSMAVTGSASPSTVSVPAASEATSAKVLSDSDISEEISPLQKSLPASSDKEGVSPDGPAGLPGSGSDDAYVPTHSFFDVLHDQQKIPENQVKSLFQESLDTGKTLEDLLLEKKLVSEVEITKAKAAYNKIDFIDLNSVGADPEALNLIDEVIAKRYHVLPFALDRDSNEVKIAMLDPMDLSAIEFLKQKTDHDIKAYYAEPTELERSIAERYSQSLSTEVTEALKTTNQYQIQKSEGVELNTSGQILRDAPINRIVENILDFAIKSRASDIHIEPQIGRVRIRYRIDGILQEKLILPKSVHEAVVSRIKIMSNLKIDEKRLPQDGRFNYVSQGKEIDLRVSTLPTVHGEKIVMRLLEKNINVPSLEDLGLRGLALRQVESQIKMPHGIILITGPTGSGKTTTLYSILHMVNNTGVNIMTLEDPVEYQIPGVNQVQINVKAGLTFASGLRSFLRQDPNIIMVGEIRDNETADLAIQASLTGHLVFSTLHTNSAAGALPRLMDMKAEPFLLSSSMLLTMGQRVVRKINDEYREEYTPDASVIADIKKVLGHHFDSWCTEHHKDPNKVTLFRAKSDRPATEPDYKGRIAIFEVMPITPEVSQLILQRASSAQIEEMAIKQGMLLMKQDGYLKALEGITTIEEVLRVAEIQQAEVEV